MYSLNAPVPPRVERLAADLHPRLTAFDSIRERHSLVVKRFEEQSLHRLRERLRPVVRGLPAVEASVTGIDVFEEAVTGPSPVVYLAVESPGLHEIHRRLVAEFGAVADLEGDDYTPHVTLARGGDVADARALADVDVESVTWTVSELSLWSREHRESVATLSLPG